MSLGQRVEADLKAALKARDKLTVSCLRLVRAALQKQAKDLRRELAEAEELQALKTLAKQRREAEEQFRKGGRPDLADREAAETVIIERYLPAQLDPAAVEQALDQIFAELKPQGPKDMGQVMKRAMAHFKGQADGKLVNQLVRRRLAD
jgi:uncharacterized protein YqeY